MQYRRLGRRFLEKRFYNVVHAINAKRALDNIGRPARSLIKRCNEYSRDVLGWDGYAPWMYVNCAIQGSFHEGWIPDNYYGKIVVPRINGVHGRMSSTKSITGRILDVPHGVSFPDKAYWINGALLDLKGVRHFSPTSAAEIVFGRSETVVLKLDGSNQGRDVTVLKRKDFDFKAFQHRHSGDSGVFQTFVNQHDDFRPVSPEAVATLRITTAVERDGSVTARSAILRIGRGGDTHVKDATGICIAVSLESGEFYSRAITADWHMIEKHPDTGVKFEGRHAPAIRECVAAAISLHESVRYVGCVGWDFAVANDGTVVLLEWNGGHNGFKTGEALAGPCFKGLGWESLWQRRVSEVAAGTVSPDGAAAIAT